MCKWFLQFVSLFYFLLVDFYDTFVKIIKSGKLFCSINYKFKTIENRLKNYFLDFKPMKFKI